MLACAACLRLREAWASTRLQVTSTLHSYVGKYFEIHMYLNKTDITNLSNAYPML